LGSEQVFWCVVLHGCSIGRVVAEGRRRVKRRVFKVRAMAVRHECRRRGLARQAMLRFQARIEGLVALDMLRQRERSIREYSLVAGLKSCMQKARRVE
jgi:hypothetical protein